VAHHAVRVLVILGGLTALARPAVLADAMVNPGFENRIGSEWAVVYAGGAPADFTINWKLWSNYGRLGNQPACKPALDYHILCPGARIHTSGNQRRCPLRLR